MSEAVIVGFLSLVGTLLGSILGILAANKLTNYRIQKLEEKVEKHNKVVERVYHLETLDDVIEDQIKTMNTRMDRLEQRD
jgi:hypothetical protein